MTLPDTDSAGTFGGANLLDYAGQPPTDPTTDRGANAVNPLVATVAGLTHLGIRAWASVVPQGTGTPLITTWDACWSGAGGSSPLNAAPTVVRNSAGSYTVTWPALVFDEVQPSGAPGYFGQHTVNFRAGFAQQAGTLVSTIYSTVANCFGNQMTFYVFVGTTPTDSNSGHVAFNVFCF